MKKSLILLSILLGVAGMGNAWADRGHGHASVGIVFGPYWGPWYAPPPPYYYPPYYYPPVVIERPAPPVYVEPAPAPVQPPAAPQTSAPPAPPPTAVVTDNFWYFCPASKTYYPYVKDCPAGWQKVTPTPPPPGAGNEPAPAR